MALNTKCPLFDSTVAANLYLKMNSANTQITGSGLATLDSDLGWEVPAGTAKTDVDTAITEIGTSGTLYLFPGLTHTITDDLTIASNVTVYVPQGALFNISSGKTLTINGTIVAGPYPIFTGTGTVKFSKNLTVYPEWWGATGDGTTDDATAINACFTSAGASASSTVHPIVRFTSLSGYGVASAVTCPEYVSIIMDSPIIYTGTGNITTLTIGEAGTRNADVELKLKVTRSTVSDWTSDSSIGIKLYSITGSKIWLDEVKRHTIGAYFLNDSGTTYNEIYLGTIYDNKYGVYTYADTGGWINENNWYGGRFSATSTTNTTTSRYGIRMGGVSASYQNNNVFYKPSFELKYSTLSGGAEAVPVLMELGVYNSFLNARHEGNSATFARESASSRYNTYTCGYGTCVIEEDGTYTASVVESAAAKQFGQPASMIFDSGNLHLTATGYNATMVGFPTVSVGSSSNATIYAGQTAITPYPDYVSLPSTRGLVVFMDTKTVKKFIVRKDANTGYGGRIAIRCYDSAGTVLTSAGAGHPYVKVPAGTLSWSTGYGGVYTIGADATADAMYTVGDDVKKVSVILFGGTKNLRIRRFAIYGVANIDGTGYLYQPAVWSGIEDIYPGARKATASPTLYAFMYNVGAVVENYEPASGEASGWICVSRVDTAMKGAAEATDASIDVDSTTGMNAGDIISILLDDGTYHNTTISGVTDADTLALTDQMPSAAAIDNPVYTVLFKAKANIS